MSDTTEWTVKFEYQGSAVYYVIISSITGVRLEMNTGIKKEIAQSICDRLNAAALKVEQESQGGTTPRDRRRI